MTVYLLDAWQPHRHGRDGRERQYQFTGLAGQNDVEEVQPEGYYDGIDRVGSGRFAAPDSILDIKLVPPTRCATTSTNCSQLDQRLAVADTNGNGAYDG